MLIYSNEFYISNNGNGYELYERDAICGNCGYVLDRQERYKGNKDFTFSETIKTKWKFCPVCGEKL